jgi:aspartyl-tRNA(Asn)/glutamyl-tRNA(Gln) amidotransferase subunit A
VPACGIVGLKPSLGEVPTAGIIPLSPSLDHAGPMARSVRDAAAIYQVLTGRTPTPVPTRVSQACVWFTSSGTSAIHSSGTCEQPSTRRCCACEAGAVLRTGEVPSAGSIAAAYIAIVLPEAAAWHAPYIDSRADGYLPAVRDRILAGRAIPPSEIQDAHATRARLCREVNALLDEGDALVLPTMPIVAPPIGASTITPDPAGGTPVSVRATMLKHTQLFNPDRASRDLSADRSGRLTCGPAARGALQRDAAPARDSARVRSCARRHGSTARAR